MDSTYIEKNKIFKTLYPVTSSTNKSQDNQYSKRGDHNIPKSERYMQTIAKFKKTLKSEFSSSTFNLPTKKSEN
jgi:hypothetical protein